MMAHPMQEPEVREGMRGETISKHPAFGQISISKVSGSRHLYGSDFTHHNYVCVRIQESELHRDLARDWFMPGKHIIEIAMSESQWATFVSSFGMGGGVPCTIEDRIMPDGKYAMMPEFPLRDSRKEFKKEADETLTSTIEHLKNGIDEINALTDGMSKAKREKIRGVLNMALRKLNDSIPFIMKQAGEHLEELIEQGKVEVNAYITSTVQRAGLDHLTTQKNPVIQIEDQNEDLS